MCQGRKGGLQQSADKGAEGLRYLSRESFPGRRFEVLQDAERQAWGDRRPRSYFGQSEQTSAIPTSLSVPAVGTPVSRSHPCRS